ncbi:MAG: hypothetical protein HY717_15925 [Planctomycetes bacterium]|nr:hypothetical protein [Planctomycetota bacterium]
MEKLVSVICVGISALAKDLGIALSTFCGWIRQGYLPMKMNGDGALEVTPAQLAGLQVISVLVKTGEVRGRRIGKVFRAIAQCFGQAEDTGGKVYLWCDEEAGYFRPVILQLPPEPPPGVKIYDLSILKDAFEKDAARLRQEAAINVRHLPAIEAAPLN